MSRRARRVAVGRLRAAGTPDGGFTLIELLVAMMVILGVLIGLMVVQASALVTSAQTRQRTQGTAFANQAMEELRALPWTVLSKGLHQSFAAASGGDDNVASGMFHPSVEPSIDEALVTASDQATDMRPLSGPAGTNATVQSDPSIPGITFVTRAYVTRGAQTPDDVLTLSVLTTWSPNQKVGKKYILLRSEAYAPQGGCGDAGNQPFLGACQPLMSVSGGSVAPATTITSTAFDPTADEPVAQTPLLPGVPYTVASMVSGQSGSSVDAQQTTSSDSSVLLPGASIVQADPDAAVLKTGGSVVQNSASNDVGSSGAAPAAPPDQSSSGSATALAISDGDVKLTLSPSSGVSGVAKASMVASCATGIPAGQGCSGATMSGGSSASVALGVGATNFSMVSLGAVTSSSFAARLTSAAGAAGVGCTTLSGAGCVAGGADRAVGTSVFGSGPWSGSAAGSGLVRVTGYTDSVRSQRGELQHTTGSTMSRSAAVQYWNGSGYSTLNVGNLTSAAVTSSPVTWTSGGATVTAVASITVTPSMSIAANPDPTACSAEGCSIDADTGTISVSVRWTVDDGTSQMGFTVATNLGTSRASAAFKAAPSA